jgi:hypothetical protein
LFSHRSRPAGRHAFSLRWLAPATACLLLAFLTFNQKRDALARVGAGVPAPIIGMTLSNLYLAAYLPDNLPRGQNAVPSDTFEWTNPVHSPLSIPSFRLAETNFIPR